MGGLGQQGMGKGLQHTPQQVISGGPAQGRQRLALALLSPPAPLGLTSQAYAAPISAFAPPHPSTQPFAYRLGVPQQ